MKEEKPSIKWFQGGEETIVSTGEKRKERVCKVEEKERRAVGTNERERETSGAAARAFLYHSTLGLELHSNFRAGVLTL